jgi:glycerophosphoryl diester phosphodiesterase
MSWWSEPRTSTAPPAVIGHRGAPDLATENTRRSFELAMSAGVDVVETDVRLTADGHIVCFHDDDFQRLCGRPERVDSVPLSEARAIFPDLLEFDDFLALTGQFPIVVDTKYAGEREIDRFVGAVEHHGALARSLFTAYSPERAQWLRDRCAQANIGIFFLEGVDEIVSARAVGARWIRVLPTDHEPAAVDGFRAEGLSTISVASALAVLGTPSERADLERLVALGIDGVIASKTQFAVEVYSNISAVTSE